MTSFITVVSGLPRSGTSLMMQMLAAGGLQPLTDQLRTADEDNPRGYYELEAVKRTRQDPSWLKQASGRAVKVIHVLLNDLPAGHDYRVIMMHRPIAEVVRSQSAMLARMGKPLVAPPEKIASMFTAQLAAVERAIAARPNFRILTVDYPDCIRHPEPTAQAIAEFLDAPALNQTAMAAAVSADLYRQRSAAGNV